jgi:putative hydrolase of the HAD superfamily
MKKHYSFDLWLTLIKSNPEFKARRDLMFYELCNPCDCSLEEVSGIIRKIDIHSNEISEITQIHIPCERMICDILYALGNTDVTYNTIMVIKNRIQSLFIQFFSIII